MKEAGREENEAITDKELGVTMSLWEHSTSACFLQPAFLMMYSAYKLNKQGDNIQP